MRRAPILIFALCAACAVIAAPADSGAGAASARQRRTRVAAKRKAPIVAAQKSSTQKSDVQKPTTQKPAAPVEATSTAKTATPKTVVRALDEAGLAKLLKDETTRGRPLLVNFWATWCTPCREEFPDLVKIDGEFRPRGLEFVTVSTDDVSEIGKAVPEFLAELRAGHIPAYLLDAADPERAIALVDGNWRGEMPATFLFDRAGKLVYKHMGRVKPDELRAAVELVLADKRQAAPAN